MVLRSASQGRGRSGEELRAQDAPNRRRSYHLSTPLRGLGSENSGQNIDESLEVRTGSY